MSDVFGRTCDALSWCPVMWCELAPTFAITFGMPDMPLRHVSNIHKTRGMLTFSSQAVPYAEQAWAFKVTVWQLPGGCRAGNVSGCRGGNSFRREASIGRGASSGTGTSVKLQTWNRRPLRSQAASMCFRQSHGTGHEEHLRVKTWLHRQTTACAM